MKSADRCTAAGPVSQVLRAVRGARPPRPPVVAAAIVMVVVAVACTSSSKKSNTTSTTRPSSTSSSSGSATSAPSSTSGTNAHGIDSCVVGTWHALSVTLTEPSTGAKVTGGAGATLTVASDGALSRDFAGATLLTGTTSGQTVEVTARGSERASVAAADGTWKETGRDLSRLTLATMVGGQAVSPVTSPNVAVAGRYQCSPTELTVEWSAPAVGTDSYRR